MERVVHLYNYRHQGIDGVRRLITALAELEHSRPTLVLSTFPREASDPPYVLGPRQEPRGPLLIGSEVSEMVEALHDEGALFHLHGPFNRVVPEAVRVLGRIGADYVYSPHDGYSPASLASRRLRKALWLRAIERRVLRRARAVHVLNEDAALRVRDVADVAATVIPPVAVDMREVDTETPPEPRTEAASRSPRLVFVGRLDLVQKGLDRALRGWAAAWSSHDRGGARFVLAGPGTAAEHRHFERARRESGDPGGVDTLGPVSEQQKRDLLLGADALVLLSRFEGYGLVVAEALSCGTEVIVSREVPLVPLIEGEGVGRVVDGDDPSAVGRAIRDALERGRSPASAARARRVFDTHMSATALAVRWDSFYAGVETSRRGAATQ